MDYDEEKIAFFWNFALSEVLFKKRVFKNYFQIWIKEKPAQNQTVLILRFQKVGGLPKFYSGMKLPYAIPLFKKVDRNLEIMEILELTYK